MDSAVDGESDSGAGEWVPALMGLISGNAAFTWIDSGGVERVLLLREPIREIRPAHRMNVYANDSLDFQSRDRKSVV